MAEIAPLIEKDVNGKFPSTWMGLFNLMTEQRDADHAHYAPQIERLEARVKALEFEAKLDESRYAHAHGDYLVQKQRADKAEAELASLQARWNEAQTQLAAYDELQRRVLQYLDNVIAIYGDTPDTALVVESLDLAAELRRGHE